MVVTAPVEIDIGNNPELGEQLMAVLNVCGRVIVDMTASTFCDSSGMTVLVRAHRLAASSGAEVRVAVNHPAVLQVFEIAGISAAIKMYPSLTASLSGLLSSAGEVGHHIWYLLLKS